VKMKKKVIVSVIILIILYFWGNYFLSWKHQSHAWWKQNFRPIEKDDHFIYFNNIKYLNTHPPSIEVIEQKWLSYLFEDDQNIYVYTDWYLFQLGWFDLQSFNNLWSSYFQDKNWYYYLDRMKLDPDAHKDVRGSGFFQNWYREWNRMITERTPILFPYNEVQFLWEDLQWFQLIKRHSPSLFSSLIRSLTYVDDFYDTRFMHYNNSWYAIDKNNAYSQWNIIYWIQKNKLSINNPYWVRKYEKVFEGCDSKINHKWIEVCCDSEIKWNNRHFEQLGGIYAKDDISIYAIWILPNKTHVCHSIDGVDADSFEIIEIKADETNVERLFAYNKFQEIIFSKDKNSSYVSITDMTICADYDSIDYTLPHCIYRTWLFPY